jgi:hypothetical protein
MEGGGVVRKGVAGSTHTTIILVVEREVKNS